MYRFSSRAEIRTDTRTVPLAPETSTNPLTLAEFSLAPAGTELAAVGDTLDLAGAAGATLESDVFDLLTTARGLLAAGGDSESLAFGGGCDSVRTADAVAEPPLGVGLGLAGRGCGGPAAAVDG